MKKIKTYEVSVINKTYSKTYSDQTKFYTSDTALELNFHLKEVEYDFDSAEIILLNVDDRSLVTRPVTKSAEGFIYELEDDIVAHYGEWKGQLKFNEGGEIYVSSPVVFRIENDLNNDRPPQLTEVNTWKTLRGIADGLIADIRSELELVAAKMSEMDSAESERQQSEASRVNAEEQRKIDHANRSAELAGKADKKQEDWIKPTLLNGWVATDSLAYPVGFYKDEFGIVRLKGRVQGGVGSIFTLPVGYRSKNVVSGFLAQATSSDTPAKVNTTTSGNVSCQNGVTGIYLDGIAFRAEV